MPGRALHGPQGDADVPAVGIDAQGAPVAALYAPTSRSPQTAIATVPVNEPAAPTVPVILVGLF